jgi:hypothetical protein
MISGHRQNFALISNFRRTRKHSRSFGSQLLSGQRHEVLSISVLVELLSLSLQGVVANPVVVMGNLFGGSGL